MGEWTYICLIFVAMFQFCCSRICLIICWLTRPVWTVVTGNGRPRYRVSTEARPCYLPGLAGHQVRSVVLFGLTHKLPRYTKDSEIYLCIESNTKLSMQASLLNIYREQPLWLMLTYHLVLSRGSDSSVDQKARDLWEPHCAARSFRNFIYPSLPTTIDLAGNLKEIPRVTVKTFVSWLPFFFFFNLIAPLHSARDTGDWSVWL